MPDQHAEVSRPWPFLLPTHLTALDLAIASLSARFNSKCPRSGHTCPASRIPPATSACFSHVGTAMTLCLSFGSLRRKSSSCSPRWTSWSQPPEARLRSKTAPNRPGKLLLHLNPGGALTKSRKAWKPSLQPACSSHRDKELLSAAPSSFFSRWVFEIYTLCKRLRLVTGTIPMSRVSLIGIGYSFTISCSSCETHFRTDRNDHTNTTTPAWGLPK